MKTLIALFLTCFTCALFGQAPPILRNPFTTNDYASAVAAIGTNFIARNSGTGNNTTISNGLLNRMRVTLLTNATGVERTNNGTVTFTGSFGAHQMTIGGGTVASIGIGCGDLIARISSPFDQYVVQRTSSATTFETDFPISSAWAAETNWLIFPSVLRVVDSEGAPAGAIAYDGTLVIYGAEGDNSAGINFVNPNATGMRLHFGNYGSPAQRGFGLYNQNGGGYAQGHVVWISTNATEGSLIIASDSSLSTGTAFSNAGPSRLTGRVTFGADWIMGAQATGGVYASNTSTGLILKGAAFSGTELFVHTNGNVGIGTNAPIAALHTASGIVIDNGGIKFGTGANFSQITNTGSEQITFQTTPGTAAATLFTGNLRIFNNGGNAGRVGLRSADSSSIPAVDGWTNGVAIRDAGSGLGSLYSSNVVLFATTNQVIFGATNLPPSSALAPTKWISVQVKGEAGVYRLPLYE